MLDILKEVETVEIEDARYKLSLERERYVKKHCESIRKSPERYSVQISRSLTPRTDVA